MFGEKSYRRISRLEQIHSLRQRRLTSGATKIDGLHLGTIINCYEEQSAAMSLEFRTCNEYAEQFEKK